MLDNTCGKSKASSSFLTKLNCLILVLPRAGRPSESVVARSDGALHAVPLTRARRIPLGAGTSRFRPEPGAPAQTVTALSRKGGSLVSSQARHEAPRGDRLHSRISPIRQAAGCIGPACR